MTAKLKYSHETITKAMASANKIGATATARKTGIPRQTIVQWCATGPGARRLSRAECLAALVEKIKLHGAAIPKEAFEGAGGGVAAWRQ